MDNTRYITFLCHRRNAASIWKTVR